MPDPAMQYGPMIPGPVAGSVDQPVAVQLRGTLGFTYLRVSHPVPEEKFPGSADDPFLLLQHDLEMRRKTMETIFFSKVSVLISKKLPFV